MEGGDDMNTYYSYNALTRVLTAEPRYIVTLDGRTIVNPPAEQYATLRNAYPKGEDAPLPEPQEGKVVEYGGYALGEDSKWHRQWTLVDAPPKPPRTFSKLKIVAALTRAGVWTQVKQYIIDANLYDLYLAAQDFAEDNEYFVQGKTSLQTALGWTDEQVEAVLSQSEV
jgi:hypothetical protein